MTTGRRLRGNEDGAVLPIVALSLVFLMTMTAFTIDLGRVMLTNRDLQKVSDLVALDLARRVDGVKTVTAINADPTFQLQKLISASRNGFDIIGSRSLTHQLGVIDRNTRQFYELHGSSVPNAVRVVAADSVNYFFFPGSSSASRGASALGKGNATCITPDVQCPLIPDETGGAGSTTTTLVGTTLPSTTTTTLCPPTCGGTTTTTLCPPPCGDTTIDQLTSASTDFEMGSFLAGVNLTPPQVELLNGLFNAVSPGLHLDAVSYQGVATSQVTLRQIAAALGLASPNDLFTTTISYKNFVLATADALSANGGSVVAVNTVRNIGLSIPGNYNIDPNRLFGKGSAFYANVASGTSAFDTYIKVLNMIEGSAFVVNGNNAISVPNLSLALPGLVPGITRVDASFTVIEGVQRKLKAHVGDVLETSQVNLTLTITVDINLGSQRVGERLRGTIVVNAAGGSAVASPSLIVCPDTPGPVVPQVRIAVTGSPVTTTGTAGLTLSVGVLDVLRTNIPGASITSAAQTGTATFVYPSEFEPSIGTGGMKRVGSTSLNLAAGFSATSGNSTVLGIPLIPLNTLINEANQGLSSSVFSNLQNTIVPMITNTLGVELSGADVGVFGIECTETLLVH